MKLTQEQVIAWAREAGLEPTTWQLSFGYEACGTHEAFERLATLAYEAGRKDENEACAKWCEAAMTDELDDQAYYVCKNLAAAIRARREHG